jgi:LPPG:FO 2-phospho-L-lactate transferase
MLVELGHEPTVVGVARLYKDICATLIIDQQDAHLASDVEKEGVRCIVTDTIMSRPGVSQSLAQCALDATKTQGDK